jgi:hypothetical protein
VGLSDYELQQLEKVREGSNTAMWASRAWITFWASSTAAANRPPVRGQPNRFPCPGSLGHTTWVSQRRKARACDLRDSRIRSVAPSSVTKVTN